MQLRLRFRINTIQRSNSWCNLVQMILDSLRTSVETILKNAQSHATVISKISFERPHAELPAAEGGVCVGEVPVSPAAGALPSSLPLPPEAASKGYVHRWRPEETEVSYNSAIAVCSRRCACCM